MSNADSRRHQQRVERARLSSSEGPTARSHADRMAAARGIHLTSGDDLRYRGAARRRIVQRRKADRWDS